MKYKQRYAELKREEYIMKKVDWFIEARHKKVNGNVLDAWKYAVKRFKDARTFLLRAIRGVDRLI
jgi:hypothetical protein